MFLSHKSELQNIPAKPLDQFNKKKLLLNDNGFKIINNICPHQGSLILTSPSNQISCGYHGWGWDYSGNPISSGNTPVCNNFKLAVKSAFEINNLVFSENIDLSIVQNIDLSHMTLVESRIDHVKTKYENIIDIFLDVDHIPVVHQSVYDSVGIGTDVHWHYYDWGSIQLVNKSVEYSKEFEETLKGMPVNQIAAFWITVYPYTTIEWQPGALFVNVCVPDNSKTDVCVFKYRDTRYNTANWQINSNIWETAWSQDQKQAEAIIKRSMFQPHLESSKTHFREWENKSKQL
jgi:phenylpropionate dioxygenase-like ring-hydroxylating dioxygenase large terminal subunit